MKVRLEKRNEVEEHFAWRPFFDVKGNVCSPFSIIYLGKAKAGFSFKNSRWGNELIPAQELFISFDYILNKYVEAYSIGGGWTVYFDEWI